jgi:hypothetical protein
LHSGSEINSTEQGNRTIIDITHIFNANYIQTNILTVVLDRDAGNLSGFDGIVIEETSHESREWFEANTNEIVPYLIIEADPKPGLPPVNLLPLTTQNPRGTIPFSWWHVPDPSLPEEDPQTGSEITVWQAGLTPLVFSVAGDSNTFTLPANTFTAYNPVFFRVRTRTQWNEWGHYSETVNFPLGQTPPLAPILVFPVGISVSGMNGVMLEWSYNSPFDTFPTRFDIRYRVDSGAWVNRTNNSAGGTPAQSTVMTEPITAQTRVEWQVRAFGALGDEGPWSDIAAFFTIGVPNAPVIVNVSNSNRPVVSFSAVYIMSWEMEIWHNGQLIYETGSLPFVGEFRHVANQFFADGNYVAQMRITNEFGFSSDWGTLPFTIHTDAPEAVTLRIPRNLRYFIRLNFDNEGKTVYIYRTVSRANDFKRIAMVTGDCFDDYTAMPGQRYEYFARVVDGNFNIADSNTVTGLITFPETVLAETVNPGGMVKLLLQQDREPEKNIAVGVEKTLTQFIGRERPVLQVGERTERLKTFSFFCEKGEWQRMEELHRSKNVLVLRDRELGVMFGVIQGSLSARTVLDGYIISFTFAETYYREEVDIV